MTLAYVALNRFGLGAVPGEALTAELKDPKAWLNSQVEHFTKDGNTDPNVYPMSHTPADFMAYCAEHFRRSPRTGASREVPDQSAGNIWNFGHGLKRQSEIARVARAIDTPFPFVERLMHFWSNHFAVSVGGGETAGHMHHHEFVQIRKNMFGFFSDLVLAATAGSPAMSTYLTQWNSLGMNSRLGGGRKAMNENLGREILELHTVGVNAGYTQEDVQEMSKVLTGFTFNGWIAATTPDPNSRLGTPMFLADAHEPGSKKVFGFTAGEGIQGLIDTVKYLCSTQACAHFISKKLLTHFFADEPPLALIDELAKAWLASGGHLPTVYRRLIDLVFDNWSNAGPKFLSHFEAAVRTGKLMRANGVTNYVAVIMERNNYGLTRGGIWSPGSPAGYPDVHPVINVATVAFRWSTLQYEMSRMSPRLPEKFPIADLGLSPETTEAVEPRSGFNRLQVLTTSADFLFR